MDVPSKIPKQKRPPKKLSKSITRFTGLILLVALSAGAALLVVRKNPKLVGLTKGSLLVEAEINKLVSELEELISLPSDETPTVATVTDAERIKEQPFFKNAKNGDKVLIYTSAKKAILYRPSERKIVEVGAVNINQQPEPAPVREESPTPSPEPTSPPEEEEEEAP